MKLFTWIDGRQSNTKYKKLYFLYFKLFKWGFDGYILKYESNTNLPIHKDPINGEHYRLNIKLKGNCEFWCTCHILKLGQRVILFRPDLFPHSLKVYTKTIKLSFGMAKFN